MIHENALASNTYSLTIQIPKTFSGLENEENQAMFDTLRDNYKLLIRHYVPLVSKYLAILSKTGGPEEIIRKAIDQKNRLIQYKDKCELLGISLSASDTTQNDDLLDEELFLEIEPTVDLHSSTSSSSTSLSKRINIADNEISRVDGDRPTEIPRMISAELSQQAVQSSSDPKHTPSLREGKGRERWKS
jgi:hypothetical protein